MSQIASQVHSRFKVFSGQLAADNTLGPLADEVANFARSTGVAAKSIGVEYLESADRLIITLGYRDDEPGYPIRLNCVSLGKIDALGNDFAALEKKMQEASARQGNIICHELYVTADQEFLMIFMTHQA
ncbi:MAG TPA: hypothetical protein VFD58_24940 [Blastocatellia bacterium]|nr:hypothetical protein [Blastocatellia bacterium]